ncbi:OmpW/AlkL family protein [Cognatilysobacter bugurensis]|uniref:Membrane protein n=1 Tax=Cognatilysobacter bugurensis TaxID=543356 RepID=A0A918T2A2_9GAMM|nr:OmpW family outer membrane protein [Lysobacter bugurensis]GHA79840.1 membrane protein [Lysobacter bugurensis]
MTPVHHSLLALAGALALIPATVAAQDTNTPKRVSITGGYALAEPTRNPQIDGARVDVDGEGTPTLGVTFHATDNIGIEAWGADKIGHRVRTGSGKAASVSAQPVALSGQYRFGEAGQKVRPFVGLGVHQTNFNEETATAGGPYAGQRIGVETVTGPMATAGVDVDLAENWFARADVRYLHGDSEVSLDGAPAGEVNLEPVVVGVGVGVRF